MRTLTDGLVGIDQAGVIEKRMDRNLRLQAIARKIDTTDGPRKGERKLTKKGCWRVGRCARSQTAWSGSTRPSTFRYVPAAYGISRF